METLLAKLSEENATLKKEVRLRDAEISGLHYYLIVVEQYDRAWSIRVNNIAMPPEDESNPGKVMEAVYSKLVHPILSGTLLHLPLPKANPLPLQIGFLPQSSHFYLAPPLLPSAAPGCSTPSTRTLPETISSR
jgi:hypothetical protein